MRFSDATRRPFHPKGNPKGPKRAASCPRLIVFKLPTPPSISPNSLLHTFQPSSTSSSSHLQYPTLAVHTKLSASLLSYNTYLPTTHLHHPPPSPWARRLFISAPATSAVASSPASSTTLATRSSLPMSTTLSSISSTTLPHTRSSRSAPRAPPRTPSPTTAPSTPRPTRRI